MREGPLTIDAHLEGGINCSAAVDLSAQEADDDESGGQGVDMRPHDFWSVGSGKTPDDVASSISDVSADCVIASVFIVEESFLKDLYISIQPLRQQQSSSAELSESHAASMTA